MKELKIKCYRLSISRTFPMTHPRKGDYTYFCEMTACIKCIKKDSDGNKIKLNCYNCSYYTSDKLVKIHTIRTNYTLWEKRMIEVQAGRAVIELFYWSDKPYRSKQTVFETLDKNSQCGVQKLEFTESCLVGTIKIDNAFPKNTESQILDITKNDGLFYHDFKDWFKRYDLSKPMAIIHFTKFRY